jgi:hypothetical protein
MDRCCDNYAKRVNSTQSAVLNGTNLVDKDCLSKFFDELDDNPGILLFVEDLGDLSFVQ